MDLKQIKDKKLILVDNFDTLIENKVDYKNSDVITFLPNNINDKSVINFYSLINEKFHKNYEDKSETITAEFYKSLDFDLALKKNITRLFYGQIGVFPFFYVIENLLKNNNTINLYTKEEKIYQIFKFFTDDNNLKINFINKSKKKFTNFYKISKFEIIKLLNLNEIIFLMKKKFYPPFKKLNNLKKNVFIHLSSESNFRILDYFLNSKWQSKLLEIDFTKKDGQNEENNNDPKILNILDSLDIIVKSHFLNNRFFYKYLVNESKNFLDDYNFTYQKISKIFENLNSKFYFLTKIIRGPLATALYDYGKTNNKNFIWVSHQHGHGIELTNIHKKSEITKEETLADILFVYSSRGRKERLKNKFINHNIIISEIGYWNNARTVKKIPNHEIIYISNLNQEIGPHEINMSSLNNSQKIEFETELIFKVFSKCKHKVLFKDYPGNKSTELKNNYFKKISKNHNNIIYFDKWLNAENIYGKSSIIITSLPTSGIVAAINSNKPLIFINIENMIPLRKEVKSEFKKFFFYFEHNENLNEELSHFLAKELEEIKSLWKSKMSNSRKNFIKKYFNIEPQEKVIKKIKKEISNIIVNN